MAKRQRVWAKKAAEKLRCLLGGCCAKCSTTADLEFDCIRPMGHHHHQRMDSSWRLSFYRAQYALNNLQLLCERCHNKKTALDQDKDFPGVNSNGGLAGSPALPNKELHKIESQLEGNADCQAAHRV